MPVEGNLNKMSSELFGGDFRCDGEDYHNCHGTVSPLCGALNPVVAYLKRHES